MDVIEFDYPHEDGAVRTRRLGYWKEEGLYLLGRCMDTGMPRTFRKDRVVRYGDGVEGLLSDPRPVMPAVPQPRSPRKDPSLPHVLFTGFPSVQRADMEARLHSMGVPVCKGVTQSCGFVVTGPNAGPAKMAAARAASKVILTWPQLQKMLETGELPAGDDSEDGITNC